MIVRFAVVGRKPAASSGSQQRAISPAVWVDRMHEDYIALVDGHGDGGLVGRRGYRRGWVEVVEGAQIVVEDWL